MEPETEIKVNGRTHRVRAARETSLLEVLRDDLFLTGTKYGCGESECGACTVLLDGRPVHACVTRLEEVGTRHVVTIEALESGDKLHPIQEAFLEEGAMQCGYCVPGMIMAAYGLLSQTPTATREEILDHMQSNICRCCDYPRMLVALEKAADRMRRLK